jgi:hypothetical protein
MLTMLHSELQVGKRALTPVFVPARPGISLFLG